MKYAVLYTETIHHEGDERSRTHPGHGYPAYTESVRVIKTFENLDYLKGWIRVRESGYSRQPYQAIQYEDLQVQTELNISVASSTA